MPVNPGFDVLINEARIYKKYAAHGLATSKAMTTRSSLRMRQADELLVPGSAVEVEAERGAGGQSPALSDASRALCQAHSDKLGIHGHFLLCQAPSAPFRSHAAAD